MTAPFQSKLIPHEDFIRQCRSKGWPYPRIAEALQKEHGVEVAASTIFAFVKVRRKKREVIALPDAARSRPISETNPADGFFLPASAPSKKSHEAKRPKFNLDL